MANQQLNNELFEKQSNFQLKDFVIRYIKYLPLIILGAVISYFLAKIKLRYTDKKYSASGTMLIKNEDGSNGSEKNIEELFTSKSKNDLNTEIALMQTRYLMRRVVERLNLNTDIYDKGKVKLSLNYKTQPFRVSLLTNLDSSKSVSFEIIAQSPTTFKIKGQEKIFNYNEPFKINDCNVSLTKIRDVPTNSAFIISYKPTDQAAANLIGSVKVKQLGDFTQLLQLSFSSLDPEMSADVVNTLMAEYINLNLEEDKTVTNFTQKFIDDRVNSLSADLERIETETRDFKEKNNSINLSAQSSTYLNSLELARKKNVEEEAKIIITQDILNKVLADDNLKSPVVHNLIEDVNLQNLILNYNLTYFERQKIREDVETEEGKIYISKTEELKLKRKAIVESLQKLITIYTLNKRESQKEINENTAKLKDIPGFENELINYGRNQKIVEELYLFLKKKGEENGIKSAATIANTKIIDPALPNPNPFEPQPKKVYSLFLFIGLMIPVLIAYILEIFNNRIRYRDDIVKQTNAPILAEIGHNDTDDTMVVKTKSRKVIAEQFRMVRTNLQYSTSGKEKFTILVTSTFSGEGKSFVSTNVAAAFAISGKKTILLEFDLRKPKVLEGLKLKKGPGISNYAVGKVSLPEIIREMPEYPNLYVVGSGAIPPNPAELLLEDSISKLFEQLQQQYDVIVIDSAPVGLVTDSMMLGKFADATLYITRHKYTLKKQIRLIDDLFTGNKLPKISIVLNDVRGNTGGYYGYGGYGYGYGKKSYGYGAGYFEEEQSSIFKKGWSAIKDFFQFWK